VSLIGVWRGLGAGACGQIRKLAPASGHLQQLKGPAKTVRNFLSSHTRKDDTVCVIPLPVNPDWASLNARETGTAWLAAHLGKS
jgi:hypothetical protein